MLLEKKHLQACLMQGWQKPSICKKKINKQKHHACYHFFFFWLCSEECRILVWGLPSSILFKLQWHLLAVHQALHPLFFVAPLPVYQLPLLRRRQNLGGHGFWFLMLYNSAWQTDGTQNGCGDLENKFMITRGEGWGERIAREFGTDMYTLPHLKWVTNKDSIAQGPLLSALWQHGWEGSMAGWVPLCSFETITTLYVNQLHPQYKIKS